MTGTEWLTMQQRAEQNGNDGVKYYDKQNFVAPAVARIEK